MYNLTFNIFNNDKQAPAHPLTLTGATVQASFANFVGFTGPGMRNDRGNPKEDRLRNRQHGVFHGLCGHVAESFQQNVGVYPWNMGGPPCNTAGKYYRITGCPRPTL